MLTWLTLYQFFSHEIYRFHDLVKNLHLQRPAESCLIKSELKRYSDNISDMVAQFENNGNMISQQTWNGEGHLNSTFRDDQYCGSQLLELVENIDIYRVDEHTIRADDNEDALNSSLIAGHANRRIGMIDSNSNECELQNVFNGGVLAVPQQQLPVTNPTQVLTFPVEQPASVLPVQRRKRTRALLESQEQCPSLAQDKSARPTKKSRTLGTFMKQVSPLEQNLQNRLDRKHHSQIPLIVSFYCFVASPGSISQVRTIIETFRGSDLSMHLMCSNAAMKETFQALDKLDGIQQNCAFMRRLLLVRFAKYRDVVQENFETHKETSSRRLPSEPADRLSTQILDRLVLKVCPSSADHHKYKNLREWREKYVDERTKIQNRLYLSRNWVKAVCRFGLGVLALIPIGGKVELQNHQYVLLNMILWVILIEKASRPYVMMLVKHC